jgi:putative membrane protein
VKGRELSILLGPVLRPARSRESVERLAGVKLGAYINSGRELRSMFSQAALNASLNGTSGVLLACGYAAIRNGRIAVHKTFMISAFAVSSVFLVSYLIYHYRVGHVAFQGQGWVRPFYFVLLTSHTLLAIVIVPMILVTLRRAWLQKFDKHRIIARWTLPLWFYVCVTGVIVYVMVYQMYGNVTH